jgi:hypothetical protein
MSTSVLMVTEVKMQKQVPQSAVSQAPQVLNGVVDSCKRRLRKWHRKFSRKKTKVVVQDEQTVHYYCPQYPVNHRYNEDTEFASLESQEQADFECGDCDTDNVSVSPEVPSSPRMLPDAPVFKSRGLSEDIPRNCSGDNVADLKDGACSRHLLLKNVSTPNLIVQKGVTLSSSLETPTNPHLSERISKTMHNQSRNDQDVLQTWCDMEENQESPLTPSSTTLSWSSSAGSLETSSIPGTILEGINSISTTGSIGSAQELDVGLDIGFGPLRFSSSSDHCNPTIADLITGLQRSVRQRRSAIQPLGLVQSNILDTPKGFIPAPSTVSEVRPESSNVPHLAPLPPHDVQLCGSSPEFPKRSHS